MKKIFTLKKRIDKKISDSEGTVTFYIADESNIERMITGTTFIKGGFPTGITAENKRELPLVEGLFRLELNEEIEIDFEYYNELFDRDSNKTINQVAHDLIMKEQKKKSFWNLLKERLIKRASAT